MKPTICRMVRFHHQNHFYPAVVSDIVDDTTVDLVVFGFRGQASQIQSTVRLDESEHPTDGSWSWPPKQ